MQSGVVTLLGARGHYTTGGPNFRSGLRYSRPYSRRHFFIVSGTFYHVPQLLWSTTLFHNRRHLFIVCDTFCHVSQQFFFNSP